MNRRPVSKQLAWASAAVAIVAMLAFVVAIPYPVVPAPLNTSVAPVDPPVASANPTTTTSSSLTTSASDASADSTSATSDSLNASADAPVASGNPAENSNVQPPTTSTATVVAPPAGITNPSNTAVTCWTKDYPMDVDKLREDFIITGECGVKAENGEMTWTMTQNCTGPGLIYGRDDILFGRSTVQIQMAPGSGVVTAFIRGKTGQDEIDWEWVGTNTKRVQTMYFVGGERVNGDDLGNKYDMTKDLSKTYVEYTIDYTADHIQWIIDGVVKRTLTRSKVKDFPLTAKEWQMDIWKGGEKSPGWAGEMDWDKAPFIARIRKLSFQSYC
ncbi:hypothetical protein H4R33_001026 [Dimargaris cristalligena]|uniref:Concanavalin A-like lectin/glucanase domain-containing protein n=1 Tax=Dimargaris cristalligena TaxID=215637 RepID=A0A4Q0A2D4_9FUNG|nr:hypothetical protein H4R33_001026 [Dimargaris cristalligena]RKP39988.1 concanavalin A-like lectin/glucanase domain-containing protein [Dimargaris cristalligena]|eukprot:RKP39988.1 concanavalin A-like lectin/glucanase domain-containing protein [Dimargaris cristalligena]